MRTAPFAKLALTAAVGIGTLFGLAGTAEAAAPPPGPGTVVMTPPSGHTTPADDFTAPTTPTTTPPDAGPALQPDLSLTNPDPGPIVDPKPQGQDADADDGGDCVPTHLDPDCQSDGECVQIPGAASDPDCEPPECPDPNDSTVPTHPDCDPDCPQPPATHGIPTDDDCDEPECPDPRASSVPTDDRDDCDDPECPDVIVLNASTHPDEPGDRRDDCDDPKCPEEDRPIAQIRSQELDEPERPEECDEPECPETDRRPTTRSLSEGEREDCDRKPPCEPKDGEDEHCKLPRTGAEMGTYVAAGVGLTGVGAALKGLARRRQRR